MLPEPDLSVQSSLLLHAEDVTHVRFQVRWEALQALCSAPPSDVLSCENWSSLQKHLGAALADPDLSVSPDTLTCSFLSQYADAQTIINYPMVNYPYKSFKVS